MPHDVKRCHRHHFGVDAAWCQWHHLSMNNALRRKATETKMAKVTRVATGETFEFRGITFRQVAQAFADQRRIELDAEQKAAGKTRIVNVINIKEDAAGNFELSGTRFNLMVQWCEPRAAIVPTVRDTEAPATRAQMDYLAALARKVPAVMADHFIKANMTKGQASRAIAAMKSEGMN